MFLVKRETNPWFKDFEESFADFFSPSLNGDFTRNLAVDVKEDAEGYAVEVDVPGFKKDEIHLNFEDNILGIVANKAAETEEKKEGYLRRERYKGSFRRQIRLGQDVDSEKITADLKDGVLTIKLAKAATPTKKPIEINVH